MDKDNKKNNSNTNNKNKKRLNMALTIICTALLSAAITSAIFMAIINNTSEEKSPNKPTSSSATAPTAANEKNTDASDAAEEATSTSPSSASDENQSPDAAAPEQNSEPSSEVPAADDSSDKVSAPEELNEMAAAASTSVSDFKFDQLITVDSDGSFANIGFYEKKKGKWVKAGIEAESGFVGSSGVSIDANEYATYTPFGLYALGTGFGVKENPGTKMEYFQVTENSYWVSDPNSKFYNQHVEGADNQDWDLSSAEHLIDYQPNYNYALFIEYNTDPVVPGKGSAFFLHVGDSPTAGCVAVSEKKMLEILKWLDPSKSPHILMI